MKSRHGLGRMLAALLACTVLGCGQGPDAGSADVLRVYNWSDYIGESTVARFEAETGIKVTYDVFDSNEVLEAKLLSGASGYDIVVPTSDFLGRQILAGVFRPLDRGKLPNHANLDPELLGFLDHLDPGNTYAVPYLWGTTGIGYNVDRVQQILGPDVAMDTLDIVFRPENLSRLARCGVAFLDAPTELFAAALHYLGLDARRQDPAVYQNEARTLLEGVRPYVTYFHSSQYINDLANGEICLAFGWSGDILQAADRAAEAGNGVRVAYAIPREGALLWFDMLAIPADARNVDNAHRFIDFLMRPEVIAEVTEYVKYANANQAATPLVDPSIRDNPSIYPTPAVRATLYTSDVNPPKVARAISRAWTAIKTGR